MPTVLWRVELLVNTNRVIPRLWTADRSGGVDATFLLGKPAEVIDAVGPHVEPVGGSHGGDTTDRHDLNGPVGGLRHSQPS